MANEEKDKPESKFAEVIRKGREKRAGMDQQTREREDTNALDQASNNLKDSES